MSIFEAVTLNCPSCGNPVDFEAVASVNADRAPDLRDAIIDGSFQRRPCPKCKTTFRLDPDMTYLHVAKGQWIAVFPVARLPEWQTLEKKSTATFALAFGARASAAAKQVGKAMKPRMTFGWGGLREKLVALDHQLDDVTLELAKAAMLRGLNKPPLAPGTEVRFVAVDGKQMVFAWIRSANEEVVETLQVPRTLYDEIVAAPEGWKALREQVSIGLFVDLFRLYIVPVAAK